MREEEVIGWLQKPWIFRTFAQSMAYAALAAKRRIVAADSGATCPATRDHCLRAKQQAHVSPYESKKEANCCIARRSRKVAEASRMAGFRLPMKTTVKCQDSLERMKLHAGSQAGDEPYRQDHGGDDPSPAAFDFGHLEFAAGDARAIEQVPHPCQPGVATK